MPHGRRRVAGIAVPLLVVTALTGFASSAGAAAGNARGFTAKAIPVASSFEVAKSTSGRLAQSDRALLKRTDSKLVNVVVKLDYDATASYAGGVRGLAATSPKVTGKKLTGKSAAELAYGGYTGQIDAKFRRDVAGHHQGRQARPQPHHRVRRRGPAASRPTRPRRCAKLPNVAAVQSDSLQPAADRRRAPPFIGAPTLWSPRGWPATGRQGRHLRRPRLRPVARAPVVRGQPAAWPAPPAKADGTPRACNFGDNPLTPANDPFVCNHKLIGGQGFLDTYNALQPLEVYGYTARDSDGHGTHTTSTAAGDVVDARADLRHRPRPDQRCRSGRLGRRVQGLRRRGLLQLGQRGGRRARPSRTASTSSTSRSAVAPRRSPTRSSWPSSTRTPRASPSRPRPATPARPPATTDHRSPWVITVAASTQTREFASTLTLTDGRRRPRPSPAPRSPGGVTTPTPVVLAQDVAVHRRPVLRHRRSRPARSTGKIVACARGGSNGAAIGRVQKGFNVQAGRRGRDDPLQPDRCRTPRPTTTSCRRCTWPTAPRSSPSWRRTRAPRRRFTDGRQGRRPGRRHGVVLLARPGRPVPQAGHHRTRRTDPGRQHPDAG